MRADQVLGFDRDGKPIYPPKPGFLYTQACILCCQCNGAICAVGGPRHGSVCLKCASVQPIAGEGNAQAQG